MRDCLQINKLDIKSKLYLTTIYRRSIIYLSNYTILLFLTRLSKISLFKIPATWSHSQFMFMFTFSYLMLRIGLLWCKWFGGFGKVYSSFMFPYPLLIINWLPLCKESLLLGGRCFHDMTTLLSSDNVNIEVAKSLPNRARVNGYRPINIFLRSFLSCPEQ